MCEWFVLRMTLEERARAVRSAAPHRKPLAGVTEPTLKDQRTQIEESREERVRLLRMKKGLPASLALVAVVVGLLMVGVGPTGAASPAFRHYIACGLSKNAKPAHSCPAGSKKGAFFKSLKADVRYRVCVKFPKAERLCTEKPQEAEQGTLYVNKITSTSVGRHEVTWYVKGQKVGASVFQVK